MQPCRSLAAHLSSILQQITAASCTNILQFSVLCVKHHLSEPAEATSSKQTLPLHSREAHLTQLSLPGSLGPLACEVAGSAGGKKEDFSPPVVSHRQPFSQSESAVHFPCTLQSTLVAHLVRIWLVICIILLQASTSFLFQDV